jgi:hypothetical protein
VYDGAVPGALNVASNRNRAFVFVGSFIVVNALLIAVLDLNSSSIIPDVLIVAFFYGTLFTHTTLIASWLAFSPKTMAQRLALASAWVLTLAAALACSVKVHGDSSNAVMFAVTALVIQFILLQPPLWGLVVGLGLQLRHIDDNQEFDPPTRQFTIGQLILLTTFAGVSLGVARAAMWIWGNELPHYLICFCDSETFRGRKFATGWSL